MKTTRGIKTRTAFLLVAICLLLGGTALAQAGGPGLGYVVQAGTLVGEGYQITGLSWRVSGSTAGGDYRLASVPADGPWGQCCCMFLPLTMRNYK